MGKTAFALSIAQHVGIKLHMKVLVLSLEMSSQQLVQRMLSSEGRVDSLAVRTGRLQAQDWHRLTSAAGRLSEAPIFIDDSPGLSVLEVRAKARRMKAEHGLDVIVIDYLQLMRGRANLDNRQQEISEISRSLKALAKELNVPVVALSQLSRAIETRGDNSPRLSDLRESGALEQDADVIMFLHRPSFYSKDAMEEEARKTAEVHIGKQRNGPTGKLEVSFLSQYARFENLAGGDRQSEPF
jgi:replicative DNA helicase